jgi:hypothetical protein
MMLGYLSQVQGLTDRRAEHRIIGVTARIAAVEGRRIGGIQWGVARQALRQVGVGKEEAPEGDEICAMSAKCGRSALAVVTSVSHA